MFPDLAIHCWFLLIALLAFVGLAIARFVDEIPPVFRIIVIGGMLGGLIFYRVTRKRQHTK